MDLDPLLLGRESPGAHEHQHQPQQHLVMPASRQQRGAQDEQHDGTEIAEHIVRIDQAQVPGQQDRPGSDDHDTDDGDTKGARAGIGGIGGLSVVHMASLRLTGDVTARSLAGFYEPAGQLRLGTGETGSANPGQVSSSRQAMELC